MNECPKFGKSAAPANVRNWVDAANLKLGAPSGATKLIWAVFALAEADYGTSTTIRRFRLSFMAAISDDREGPMYASDVS